MTAVLWQRKILERWLALGLVWWLVGMLLVATSKHYQQLLIALFWLPGFLALACHSEVRRGWLQPLAIGLIVFAFWSAISVSWSAQFDSRELKIFLYVFLAANAVIALACLNPDLMWRAAALSALLAGFLAWASVLWFYGWRDQAWSQRVGGVGVADHPILSGHLFGALGILLLYLRRQLPVFLQRVAWLLASLGFLIFLALSQSKGPWLAVLVTLALASLWQRSRLLLTIVGVSAIIVVVCILMWPDLLLQRGFSYRPELFSQAVEKIKIFPLQGLGFTSEYQLLVPSLNVYFEHAHNIYLHIAVTLGLIGLAFWLTLQAQALTVAWQLRRATEGRMLCALICFAAVALFTDGIGPWVKPREEWFSLWLPIFLTMGVAATRRLSHSQPAVSHD